MPPTHSKEYYSEKYQAMYYKSNNSIGVRRKFDKKKTQVISFGGMRCSMNERRLRALADATMEKLDNGLSERRSLAWSRKEVERLSE